ncbi:hypothetical protein [Actinoplanes teichomyceticus]|uniref:Uncharacterized protein n=1 Tax=Actinoplanes teichomyceticus TaxID=1867 RepID=A0A561WIL8_ACTTI|nr:hypothetical protein [Actinoplanes teichomyceticus]TWG23739.1 hypothetical protein FHX34_102290 [Actinoplanes teichomyceticus]GIF11780.1 hypothetical protein Ate01nite_18120 [Actinoplanes teichomyceticus]
MTVEDLGPRPEATSYTFAEARAVVVQYLDFLAPTRDDRERSVTKWEQENGRPFPGRTGVIG